MEKLPHDCWTQKHKVYEDMLICEHCEERVFFCHDCKKLWLCVEKDNEIFVKEELPISISTKDLAKKLHWMES